MTSSRVIRTIRSFSVTAQCAPSIDFIQHKGKLPPGPYGANWIRHGILETPNMVIIKTNESIVFTVLHYTNSMQEERIGIRNHRRGYYSLSVCDYHLFVLVIQITPIHLHLMLVVGRRKARSPYQVSSQETWYQRGRRPLQIWPDAGGARSRPVEKRDRVPGRYLGKNSSVQTRNL